MQEETAEVTPVGSDRPALAGVREALAGGDRLLAMDLLTTYVGGGGGDPVAAALADQVLVAARTEAERQRRAATARLGGVPAGDAMNTARRREAMGQEAWRAGQYGAALRAFLGAQEGYSRVQSSTPEAIAALPEPPAPVALPPPPTAAPTAPTTLPASGATATAVPPASASRPPVAVPPSPAPAPSIDAPRPVSTPDPARSETSAADAASPSTGGADAGVRRALRAYQSAYETLDAGAAAAVYPAVDARALGRAFDGLRSQKLDFERCDVTGVTGDRAQATCLGRLAFVPRVGSQTPKVEARRWTFVLQRQGDAWRIQQAQVGPR